MIVLENINKIYEQDSIETVALKEVSLTIAQGEFACLAGPSGSGKTTLLNLIGCLDRPTTGSVRLNGQEVSSLKPTAAAEVRRQTIGFVFQSYNLIPVLSVYENVEYVLLLQEVDSCQRKKMVMEALNSVNMEDYRDRRPNQLSGGQQQRVAVARAIVAHPPVVLADEPTGNLDSKNGSELINLFKKLNHELSSTFLFSSHDPRVINNAQRVILLEDGMIAADRHK